MMLMRSALIQMTPVSSVCAFSFFNVRSFEFTVLYQRIKIPRMRLVKQQLMPELVEVKAAAVVIAGVLHCI